MFIKTQNDVQKCNKLNFNQKRKIKTWKKIIIINYIKNEL